MEKSVVFSCAVLFAAMALGVAGADFFSLNGDWRLRQGGREAIRCPIPGDNYSALLNAGLMPDPFVGTNEWRVQQFADEDAVFSRTFDAPAGFLDPAFDVRLEFGGLSPAATVVLNGATFAADSQFRRWDFDVTKILKAKGNELVVKIASPRRESVRRKDAYGRGDDVMSFGCGTMRYVNFLRQAQCQAGWDWGVSLPAVGITGGVRLRRAKTAFLDYVWTEQAFTNGTAFVTVVAELTPTARAKAGDEVTLVFGFGDSKEPREATGRVPRDCGAFRVATTFEVKEPKLWWPNGYGEPHRYGYAVSLKDAGASRFGEVGLRTVELVREKDADGKGESFYFRVNGVRIFAKGWNWIPTEAFPSRRTFARTKSLLESAAAANANMIRIWGGGVYEPDGFYHLCDRLGLLVWQDMMFACGEYPADDPAFRANVRAEVAHQVKRLRAHPSIALWCGDNELYWCSWQTPSWLALCDRLTTVTTEAANAADPSRVFWPSSPCAGDRLWGDPVFDPARGDSHCWAGEDRADGKIAECFLGRRVRFMSEYGWCSYPKADYLRRATGGTLDPASPEMANHAKKPTLARDVRRAVAAYLGEPRGDDALPYLSQVLQARILRKSQNRLHAQMPSCGGVLDWQLNDWWPALSWSKIDGALNWKASMHAAKGYNAPVVAFLDSASMETGGVLTVVSDFPVRQGSVTATTREIATGKAVATETHAFDGSRGVWTFGAARGEDRAHYLELVVTAETPRGAFTNRVDEFLSPIAETPLPDARVTVKSVTPDAKTGVCRIVLATDKPAFGVMASVDGQDGGRFDRNFLTLLPGEHALVYTPPYFADPPDDLLGRVRVDHLAAARKAVGGSAREDSKGGSGK